VLILLVWYPERTPIGGPGIQFRLYETVYQLWVGNMINSQRCLTHGHHLTSAAQDLQACIFQVAQNVYHVLIQLQGCLVLVCLSMQ